MVSLISFTLLFSGAVFSMVPVEEYPELSFTKSEQWVYSQGLIRTSSTTPIQWLATRPSQLWGRTEAYLDPGKADLFTIDPVEGLLFSETSGMYLSPAVPASFLAVNVSREKPSNPAQKWNIDVKTVPEKSQENVALEGVDGLPSNVPSALFDDGKC